MKGRLAPEKGIESSVELGELGPKVPEGEKAELVPGPVPHARVLVPTPRSLVKSAKGRGDLINRLGRTALDVLVAWGYDKLIAVVNGHSDPEGTARACMGQVPGHIRVSVHLIIFTWSIEEWV